MMMPRCGCRFIGKRSGTEYGNAKGPLSLEGAEIAANLLRPRAVHRYLRPDIEADIRTLVRAPAATSLSALCWHGTHYSVFQMLLKLSALATR
jgi:hypothetical protein